MVVAIPLAMDPGGYFIFLPLKSTLATVLVATGITAAILQRRPLAKSIVLAAWGCLLLALVVASVIGIGGLTSWIGYPDRSLGVITWIGFAGALLLAASLLDPRDRVLVVRAAAAASILVSAYALLQAIHIDPIAWSENVNVDRTRSTLGNAAFLGAYLAMIVPLTARLALSPTEPVRMRFLHATAAVVGSIALLTTETRGAWLGAVTGVVVVLALEFRRLRTRPTRSAVVLGAGLLVLFLLGTLSPYAARVRSIGDLGAATGRGRLTQWERTLDLIERRPVLGWGPETYAFVFPRFIDPTFEQTVGREVVPDRAHNIFLDLAASAGALGVGAYLVVLGLIVRTVARARQRDPLTVALMGACVAYLVQLQFSFPLADLDTIFWLFAGVLLASTGTDGVVVSRRWAGGPLIAALLLAAWGTSNLLADRTLRDSLEAEASGNFTEARRLADRASDLAPLRTQYLQADARLRTRMGELSGNPDDFRHGLAAVDDALDLMPNDLELAMDRADLLLSWGETVDDERQIARSAAEYERILERDPASSRVHLKLGVAYVQMERTEDAEREWLTAASLSPRSPGPRSNLGLLYEQQGRTEDARRALREALELDPTNDRARDALERLGS